MNLQLPEDANLEHLKSQAKALLKSLRAGDPVALSSVAGLPNQAPYQLAHAQLAVARQYGFESWSKLKRHVEGFAERRDAFFAAIKAGDRERVRTILIQDRAICRAHDQTSFGASPITLAANRNDIPMIDLLLDNGANIDARSTWWAGSFGALDFADDATSAHLLKRGATLTPHAAARLGMAEALHEMIARDPAVVHERGGDGQYPLHFAKTPEIVDMLLDAGADIDARDIDHEGTPLQTRIQATPVARRLFERGAAPDIFSAVALGEVALVEKFLDEDPGALVRRTDEPGNPMVPHAPGWHIYTYTLGFVQPHQAASNLRQDAVYEFLWERSSPVLRLKMAAWRGDLESARAVMAENPGVLESLTEADRQMLPSAASERRVPTVRALLGIGIDRDTLSRDGWAATNWAGFLGLADVIEAILPFHPDLGLKNPYGGTPLTACIYGSVHNTQPGGDYPRSVELLIAAGSPLPAKASGSREVNAVLERHRIPTA